MIDQAFVEAEARAEAKAFQDKMDREIQALEIDRPKAETKKEKKSFSISSEEIREKLETNNAWLERAVLAIYEKQTSDEQRAEETKYNNGVGFNSPDSHYLSYVARWLKSGKHLSRHHLGKTRAKMLKYSGQLAQIAEEKKNG